MHKIIMKLNAKNVVTAILTVALIVVVIITIHSFKIMNKRINLQMPEQGVMVEETTEEESTVEQSVDEQ